ncbi:hypothetical protein [Flavobacterium sp. LS1P3]|uniref:hypothetical protein n=1 Tax=Flavobacterium sp. LS1P3 TaxID=3401720 RepID=UPI003AABDAEC
MEDKINEELICTLVKNQTTNQIEVGYVQIQNSLIRPIDEFLKLCDDPNTSLNDLIAYIRKTTELNLLTDHYLYCVLLARPYQGFNVNNQDTIIQITNRQQLIQINHELKPDIYNPAEKITEYKQELKEQYLLWSKAFAIKKTYRICNEDKSVLTFSHRLVGWSNPLYQLTPNFSVEIKTNFGYGSASYFYTKLKYKNIEISPFSEWIDYEFAKFSEIIRYTQKHLLENKYWLEAMNFSKDACNLSMTDEVKFVEKYVIDECEKMLIGLEGIFSKDHFSFKDREKQQYSIDKKGHLLTEFRGEKISGALDFISKILEFETIAEIKSFIQRIETCNRKIQPILIEELKIIKVKLSNFNSEMTVLKPKYLAIVDKNLFYIKEKTELQRQMTASKQFNPLQYNSLQIDMTKVNLEFTAKFPEFEEFQKEFKSVSDNYRILTEQIQNLTKLFDNITTYNNKISNHFGQ